LQASGDERVYCWSRDGELDASVVALIDALQQLTLDLVGSKMD